MVNAVQYKLDYDMHISDNANMQIKLCSFINWKYYLHICWWFPHFSSHLNQWTTVTTTTQNKIKAAMSMNIVLLTHLSSLHAHHTTPNQRTFHAASFSIKRVRSKVLVNLYLDFWRTATSLPTGTKFFEASKNPEFPLALKSYIRYHNENCPIEGLVVRFSNFNISTCAVGLFCFV